MTLRDSPATGFTLLALLFLAVAGCEIAIHRALATSPNHFSNTLRDAYLTVSPRSGRLYLPGFLEGTLPSLLLGSAGAMLLSGANRAVKCLAVLLLATGIVALYPVYRSWCTGPYLPKYPLELIWAGDISPRSQIKVADSMFIAVIECGLCFAVVEVARGARTKIGNTSNENATAAEVFLLRHLEVVGLCVLALILSLPVIPTLLWTTWAIARP